MSGKDGNHPFSRRKSTIDARRQQFATQTNHGAKHIRQEYPHRLNMYTDIPREEITLEDFENWSIGRLYVLAELELCILRNKSFEATVAHMTPIFNKHMPLHANSVLGDKFSGKGTGGPRNAAYEDMWASLQRERMRDHYSHYILRLAFAQETSGNTASGLHDTLEARCRRFIRLESFLFRLRWRMDDARERQAFLADLPDLGWKSVSSEGLPNCLSANLANDNTTNSSCLWFKGDWLMIPDLVESRRAIVENGIAYIASREIGAVVATEFTRNLERSMEKIIRTVPLLEEDERLTPLLNHLANSFMTPSAVYDGGNEGAAAALLANAYNIPRLARHFPACMQVLQQRLAKLHHLKYHERLQYTLFLKGVGLTMNESLVFWKNSFSTKTAQEFDKDYRYNVQHAYGAVGGDTNRRMGGQLPFSCQKLLSNTPSVGLIDAPFNANTSCHGCPFRSFNPTTLDSLLRTMGVTNGTVLNSVREDVKKLSYHTACNRVFDSLHATSLQLAQKGSSQGRVTATSNDMFDTIRHPNEYFKRSFTLTYPNFVEKQTQANQTKTKEPVDRENINLSSDQYERACTDETELRLPPPRKDLDPAQSLDIACRLSESEQAY